VKILSDQPDDLLVRLVQLDAAVAGVLSIVLAIYNATAAAVVVDGESIVFRVVSIGGCAAARGILISDTDAVLATAGTLAGHVLGAAAGIEGGTLQWPGAGTARRRCEVYC